MLKPQLEFEMAKLATQITFGDYAKWRAGFDKAAPLREKAGMKNVQVYRDVDNPSSGLIWSDIDDPAKARAVLDSPEGGPGPWEGATDRGHRARTGYAT